MPEAQPLPEETTESVQTTAPEEEPFEPLDGSYIYTNGKLELEFQHVIGVQTRMVQDENGVEFAQTALLTEPGVVVSAIDADMYDGKEAWRLCETTGAYAPILITDEILCVFWGLCRFGLHRKAG